MKSFVAPKMGLNNSSDLVSWITGTKVLGGCSPVKVY